MKRKFKLSTDEINYLNKYLVSNADGELERIRDSTKTSVQFQSGEFCINTCDKVLIQKINSAIMESFAKKPYDEEILIEKINGERISVESWEVSSTINSEASSTTYSSVASSLYYSIISDPQDLKIVYKLKPHTYKVYTKNFQKVKVSLETDLDLIFISLTYKPGKSTLLKSKAYNLELLSNTPVQVQICCFSEGKTCISSVSKPSVQVQPRISSSLTIFGGIVVVAIFLVGAYNEFFSKKPP